MDWELQKFYKIVDDYRGYWDEIADPREWRIKLREKLYKLRGKRSDLTQMPLIHSFDMHEGILSRRWVGKHDFQSLLFSGVNCLLLNMEEHRNGDAPDRTTCYWLSVARYGKDAVDKWITSLPFKSKPSTPWCGTNGRNILREIPNQYIVSDKWYTWFDSVAEKVDFEA